MGLMITVLDSKVLEGLDQYVLGEFQPVLINQMSSHYIAIDLFALSFLKSEVNTRHCIVWKLLHRLLFLQALLLICRS